MTDEKRNEFFWKEWRDILLAEFESRMAAVGAKGQGIVPASKNLHSHIFTGKRFFGTGG